MPKIISRALMIVIVLLPFLWMGATQKCPSGDSRGKQMQKWLATAGFQLTLDTGAPDRDPHHLNNIDFAVIAFSPNSSAACPPIYAEVILSRDFPFGHVVAHNASTLQSIDIDWH